MSGARQSLQPGAKRYNTKDTDYEADDTKYILEKQH